MMRVDLWFEALPSPATANSDRLRRDIARIAAASNSGISRIVVPEVLDGDHATVDNLAFAYMAREATGLPVTSAIITAKRDEAQLAARIAAADHVAASPLFVGPTCRKDSGVSVERALHLHGHGRAAGVVTIPQRRRWRLDEPQRLLRKQRAGGRFALSQILFGARDAISVRHAFLNSLSPHESPIPIIYSLAPVSGPRDVAFLRRLGVHIPPVLAARLESTDRQKAAQEASVAAAVDLAVAHNDDGLGPFGFCISHVMVPNVEAAFDLATGVRDALRSHVPSLKSSQPSSPPLHASIIKRPQERCV